MKTGCARSMAFAVFVHLIACLAVVLLPIAVDDSDASSPSQANAESNAGTNCAWDCNIIDPKFGLEMKVLISEFKIVTVQLKYEQQEEKQCSHLTDLKRNSSLAGFWIWQTCNIPSHGGQNMSQHSFNKSNNWFQKSLEGQIEVGVSCSLKPATDSNDTNPSVNDVIAMVLLEEVANFTKFFRSAFCYSFSANNSSYVCMNLTTNTARTVPVTWQKSVFRVLVVFVLVISLWYFVLLLCLFTPTELKDKETKQVMLVLHGTSPQGVRSWIANNLTLFDDSMKEKRFLSAFFFFLFAIAFLIFEDLVIDVYLVPPKLLSEIDTWNSRLIVMSHSVSLLMMMMFGRLGGRLYFQESKNSSCFICRVYGDKKDIFHDKKHPKYYGLNEMKMHLFTQPVIVVRCLSQFFTFAACLCPCSLVKWLLVLLLLPLWFPIYLLCDTVLLLYSSPLWTLYYILLNQRFDGGKMFCLGMLEINFIIYGYFTLALEIASDSVTIIRGCLMRLPNYLPFASLGLVTIFFLWKVYAPYPRKYNVLAVKLHEYYTAEKKKRGVHKLQKGYIPRPRRKNSNFSFRRHSFKRYPAKRAGAKNRPVCCSQDSLRVIPIELYKSACRKLMPPQESISGLVIAFFFILILILLPVLVVITEASRLDHNTKALGTLVTMLIPTIIEMFLGENPAVKKANEDAFDKRVASVVKEYFPKTQQRNFSIANQDTNNNNNNNNCTSGGNEAGFQIKYEIVNGNSDNGSSEGNERSQLRLIISPSSDPTPLLSCQYGTFDHSEDTTQRRTATGTLSASSETLV